MGQPSSAFALIGCCSPLLRDSLYTLGGVSLPFCNATRGLALSIDLDADSGGFRRANSGGERGGMQCGEHGSGILVDDSEQSASRRFWAPPPSLPVLDRIQA